MKSQLSAIRNKRLSKNKKTLCVFILVCVCLCLIIQIGPEETYCPTISGSYHEEHNSGYAASGDGSEVEGKKHQYSAAIDIDKLIEICKKYSDKNTVDGIRNQINWMKQLYSGATQGFVSHLGLGDSLLIAILNHADINQTLMTASYSTGDINREIARQILAGADGYASVDTIAKATGLKAKDVRGILERIAAGTVTEKTIALGKNRTRASTHGVYVNNQALKQDKVYKALLAEVERMTSDADTLSILYKDLGEGYVSGMLAGNDLDKYQVMLYKEYLAKVLDDIVESNEPYSVATYDVTKSAAHKVTKTTKSALSGILSYKTANDEASLPEDVRNFLDDCLGNGVFSESEAREYLILSGAYEAGEPGISDAAKQLVKGYKRLEGLEDALGSVGDVIDAVEYGKMAEEFFDYWLTDYAEQEVILDNLVQTLSDSGADMELLVAAKDLQEEYENKLDGTFDKVYDTLIDEGIGAVKSGFLPLSITESCISLTGTLTGASDHVEALETGLAMQGICKQALTDYEKAVVAVQKGDGGEEAVSNVISTFGIARQSLITYYEAMVQLSESSKEKSAYTSELAKLKNLDFEDTMNPSYVNG